MLATDSLLRAPTAAEATQLTEDSDPTDRPNTPEPVEESDTPPRTHQKTQDP